MDLNRFVGASFTAREATLQVPELSEFFGDAPAEWVVRGLSGAELGWCNEASDRGKENAKAIIAAMAGVGDKAEAIREAMGLSSDDVPEDVSRRIEMLAMGSVSPALGAERRDVAVKLAEAYPTTFYNLTNRILALTGMGAEMGKRKPSGSSQTSKPS